MNSSTSRRKKSSRSRSRGKNDRSQSNDNTMLLSGDFDDDIPQFANFDDFPQEDHQQQQQQQKTRSNTSHSNGSGNSSINHNHHPLPISPRKKKSNTSTSTSNTGASMGSRHMGGFDQEAANDFKWAKMQANSELTKGISPVQLTNQTLSSTSSIRIPAAGLVRSISRNSRRDRSITPEQQQQHQQAQAQAHQGKRRGKELKTRTRSRSPAPPISSKQNHHRDSTPTHENKDSSNKSKSKNKNKARSNSRKLIRPIISSSKRSIDSANQYNNLKQHHQAKEEIKRQKYYANKKYTFQNPLHELVTYRINDLASRIAFEKIKSVTVSELEAIASKRPLSLGENGHGNGHSHGNGIDDDISPTAKQNRLKRLSPSPQYVELLDCMSKISYTRQLCWSPSVSREADPFYGWGEEDSDDDINNLDDIVKDLKSTSRGRSAAERDRRRKLLLKRKRRQIAASKSGSRCTQIDATDYIQDTLLDHAPLLTNIRRRLPMRSDVGFPGATEEEINSKQSEIAKEAQLEEISPRLSVMLSSNDVGLIPELEVDRIIDQNIWRILQYSLPGMPYAGKELMMKRKMQKKASVVLRNDLESRDMNKGKPDSSSMFAPPIDSVISSTEMWRSRPFSDRPAGLSYSVAIPIHVRFTAGCIEPLICTLALYCLPTKKNTEATKLRGKISEDYIFSAGDWGDLLEQKAGEILAQQFGMSKEGVKSGKKQKGQPKKALFSFDQMALPKNERGGLDSLYLVMNVHKVTHRDAGVAYMNNTSMKSTNSNKNTISGLFFGASASTSSLSSRQDVSNAKAKAKNAFDAFGSQFLTPFCFGLIPLFPSDPERLANENDAFEWPNGISQSMLMFSHPTKPESQEAFVERITAIAQKTSAHAHIVDEVTNSLSNLDSASFDDDSSNIIAISSEDSINSRSSGSKIRRPKFKFRKRKNSKRHFNDMTALNSETCPVDGTAIFYTSRVGADFSQTMLQYPPFLEREDTKEQTFPRLLVDVSGDCAIMVNPDHSVSSRKKRSNLIRLPPSSKLSGYSDSCEIREILYLPFQNNVKYDTAPHLSPQTSLNLLYLYPRLLKKVSTSETDTECSGCFSVRISLVHQRLEIDNITGDMSPINVPSESIYNPAPGSETLLQAVYTKIPLGCTGKSSKIDIHDGINLQDEVKVRLPTILDGSHFLQFTLYSVDLKADDKNSSGLNQNFVSDVCIPLSSSRTVCGKRVTTVIPNDLYKIKIGDFELQIISRLVSTIHISDPAVATVVRDFSSVDDNASNKLAEQSGDPAQLSRILSKASEQSLYSNFNTLVFIHLRAFVKIGLLSFDFKKRNFSISSDVTSKMEYFRSLFKLIDKTKKRCQQVDDRNSMNRFIKSFLDTFDEQSFHPNAENQQLPTSNSSQSMSNISIESDPDLDLLSDNASNKIGDRPKEAKTKTINFEVDEKILHARYADNAVPFSRKAYGVSKIDRMKAEAELYETGQMLTELYDDDETVVTASTWHSHPHISASATSFSIQRPSTAQSIAQSIGQTPIGSQVSPEIHHSDTITIASNFEKPDSSTPFERARSMARRVNHVAQIFMAPCTAPNFYDSSLQSPDRRKLSRNKRTRQPIEEKSGGLVEQFHQMQAKKKRNSPSNNAYCSGSDVEEEMKTEAFSNNHFSPYPNSPLDACLRGVHGHLNELELTVPEEPGYTKDDTPEPFIYEIVLTMWMYSSKQHEVERDENSSKNSALKFEDHELFMKHVDFLLPLCLKSLALRCLERRKSPELVPSLVLDKKHMYILEPLIEKIAKGFVKQVLICESSVDLAIANVLATSDTVLDFLIGLLTLIHPSQVSWLIFKYLETLRLCEEDQETPDNTASTEITIKRIRANRQLRLRAAEKLSSMPRFIALNFPYKIHPYKWLGSNTPCSWTNQMIDNDQLLSGNVLIGSPDRVELLPETNWLAEILSNECFIICSQSCEAIVNGTISQVKGKNSSKTKSAMRQRISISKQDMAHYHSIGYHAVSIAYDLVLRMHATDHRYQSKEARDRIAGIFVSPVIDNALQAVHWLSKMEAGSKIRSIWLLCILYILQEAPETALHQQMHAMCLVKSNTKESRISRFIRILKLCTMTFQSFTDTQYLPNMAPWLVQESFNIISASLIVLVDECYEIMSQNPYEQTKMVERALNLLLHIVSAPLSSVTLLRALGAVSHILDKVGASSFLDAVEDDLQHWGRIIFSLMNNTSLSVRSMAVDLTVSLFGSMFKEGGNIDEVAQVFLTVLPEVVAREIALYSINGFITNVNSVESSMWPLRRALADVEGADPIDDDRVDAQLVPFLGQFCRACQAAIDGVLIELRLQGNNCQIIDTKVMMLSGKSRNGDKKALPLAWTFDADEESLFEAASFFVPESSPLQRIRWLLTLKSLHEVKGQWVEAGDTLILCAKTVAEAIPHVRDVWRPSQFTLWTDPIVAPWLATIGGIPSQRNTNQKVMGFAHDFLEPSILRDLIASPMNENDDLSLSQPNIPVLCKILDIVSKEAVRMYNKENGMDPLSFARLEELLKIVMGFVEEHALSTTAGMGRRSSRLSRAQSVEEIAALRKVSASINELVTQTAEGMLFLVEQKFDHMDIQSKTNKTEIFFVRMQLAGKKCNRFLESTTIPTFLDWDVPYVCRVPSGSVMKAINGERYKYAKKNMKSGPTLQQFLEDEICTIFAEPYVLFLEEQLPRNSIQFCTEFPEQREIEKNESKTLYLIVTIVRSIRSSRHHHFQSKKFHCRSIGGGTDEITVANYFPCALSRQATLITRTLHDAGTYHK